MTEYRHAASNKQGRRIGLIAVALALPLAVSACASDRDVDLASYVETIERRQGVKLGCPEEAALVRGFLSLGAFKDLVERMPDCEYRHYLEGVAREAERHKWYPEKAARHG